MFERLRFLINRLREQLWVKPLAMCVLSVTLVFMAKLADGIGVGHLVPDVKLESVETLLTIISSTMMVIATFAVGSMVSAYASASNTATPRSFSLIVADDVSQNALSTFIGAFIFSIVALISLKNGYFDKPGRFTLFALTLLILAMVILTFVRWVNRIARLGRLGETLRKVEAATTEALQRRRCAPHLRGVAPGVDPDGRAVYSDVIGYVQRVDVVALQTCAKESALRVTVMALPGTFAAPDRVLAYVKADAGQQPDIDMDPLRKAFVIGDDRSFDDDPRFGLIALSEIASRALSPAVNDPGTAIDVIGRFVRLFALWRAPLPEAERQEPAFDRVAVPALSVDDLFEDAFSAVARDGAGTMEVAVRLQKAYASLASIGDDAMRRAAVHQSRIALTRAEQAMVLPEETEALRQLARAVQSQA